MAARVRWRTQAVEPCFCSAAQPREARRQRAVRARGERSARAPSPSPFCLRKVELKLNALLI